MTTQIDSPFIIFKIDELQSWLNLMLDDTVHIDAEGIFSADTHSVLVKSVSTKDQVQYLKESATKILNLFK